MKKKKENLTKQKANGIKPDVMRGIFELTINDGFVTYKYQLTPKEKGDISIGEIWERIREEFEAPDNKGVMVQKYLS